jgi:hypothetical protein
MGQYGHAFDSLILENSYELVITSVNENALTDALKKFISNIKHFIVKCIDKINSLLDKHPDSKIANALKDLLNKFKKFLTKADKVENKSDASELKSDVEKASERMNEIEAEMKFDIVVPKLTAGFIKKEIDSRMPDKEGVYAVCLVRRTSRKKEVKTISSSNDYAETNFKISRIYHYVTCHFGYQDKNSDKFKVTESIKIGYIELDNNLESLFDSNGDEIVIEK